MRNDEALISHSGNTINRRQSSYLGPFSFTFFYKISSNNAVHMHFVDPQPYLELTILLECIEAIVYFVVCG